MSTSNSLHNNFVSVSSSDLYRSHTPHLHHHHRHHDDLINRHRNQNLQKMFPPIIDQYSPTNNFQQQPATTAPLNDAINQFDLENFSPLNGIDNNSISLPIYSYPNGFLPPLPIVNNTAIQTATTTPTSSSNNPSSASASSTNGSRSNSNEIQIFPMISSTHSYSPIGSIYSNYQNPHHHHHYHNHNGSSIPEPTILVSKDGNEKRPLPKVFNKMIRTVARHFLDDDGDRKYYSNMYSCMPPPFFILTITLIELIFFIYYAVVNPHSVTSSGPIPTDSIFIYRSDRKDEIWRFFLYMVLHAGWLHLIFNLSVQLLVGLPLEMVHGSGRIGIIYMSGVLAGSLATSVFDSNVYLVGASGGVYALLAAHLSNVLLNYNQLDLGMMRVFGVFLIASVDVSMAIYQRYLSNYEGSVSYSAHLAGALSGLTIGLLVLKNFEQKLHEQLIWWVALGIYTACVTLALMFNIFK